MCSDIGVMCGDMGVIWVWYGCDEMNIGFFRSAIQHLYYQISHAISRQFTLILGHVQSTPHSAYSITPLSQHITHISRHISHITGQSCHTRSRLHQTYHHITPISRRMKHISRHITFVSHHITFIWHQTILRPYYAYRNHTTPISHQYHDTSLYMTSNHITSISRLYIHIIVMSPHIASYITFVWHHTISRPYHVTWLGFYHIIFVGKHV